VSDPTDFSAEYANMSDAELMTIARDYADLTDSAQAAIRAEFAKRNLEPPTIDPPEQSPESNELVTVKRFRDLPEAAIAKSMLESAEVPSWLLDENLVRIDWGYSQAVGGIRLQVRREDESAAKELLAQRVPDSIQYSDADKSYQQPRCPACGSRQIGLLSAFDSLRAPADTWECSDCGARWEDPGD